MLLSSLVAYPGMVRAYSKQYTFVKVCACPPGERKQNLKDSKWEFLEMNQMLTHRVQHQGRSPTNGCLALSCRTESLILGLRQTGAQFSQMSVLFNLNKVMSDFVYSLTLQKLASNAIRLSLKESVKCEKKAISCWCNQLYVPLLLAPVHFVVQRQ